MDSVTVSDVVAAVSGVVASGYAIYKFFRFVQNTRRKDSQETQDKKDDATKKRKREAADEAWQVADRLQALLTQYDEKLSKIQKECNDALTAVQKKCDDTVKAAEDRADIDAKRAQECEKEHARSSARLEIIEGWAVSKGLKIPPAKDHGSDVHRPVKPPHQQGERDV